MSCTDPSSAMAMIGENYQETGEQTTPLVGEEFAPGFKLVVVPFGMVVLACGVLGNGFLLVVLGTQRSMWKVHNIFIASLTFADLLVVCGGLPFQVIDIIVGAHPVASVFHCRLNGFVTCLGFGVSVMSLVCVSFNRFMKVCHTRYFERLFSVRKNVVLCVVMWFVTMVLLIPLLFGDTTFGYDARSHACTVYERKPMVNYRSVVMLSLLVAPPAVIGYFNFKIFQFWKKSKKRSKGRSAAHGSHSKLEASTTSLNVERGSSLERLPTASYDSKVKDAPTDSTAQRSANEGTSGSDAVSRMDMEQSAKVLNGACETAAATADGNQKEREETEVQGRRFPTKKILSFPDLTDDISTSCAANSMSSSGQHSRHKVKGRYCKVENPNGRSYLSKIGRRAKKTAKVKSYRREFALVRSLLTVAICLFVFYLPYALCLVVNLYVRVPTEVMILGTMFLFTNCSINWIIYGAMNTSFRRAYMSTIRACYPRLFQQNAPKTVIQSSCTGSQSSLHNNENAVVAISPC